MDLKSIAAEGKSAAISNDARLASRFICHYSTFWTAHFLCDVFRGSVC